ncbi:MAG: dethiobiotin synthase [Cyanobacteria bacterium]|nr:dethiobiotin synthase [Cyanobacteriota bacterium]
MDKFIDTNQALFITGTDTNVGKTVITAGLAAYALSQGKSVCVFKPIQTGSSSLEHPEDPEQVLHWVDDKSLTIANSYNFFPPATPYVADEGRTIQIEKILNDFESLRAKHDLILVEGAGGVRVPVSYYKSRGMDQKMEMHQIEMIDIIKKLDLPTIVVSRPNLGTINHTLMTVDCLTQRNIEVSGLVLSNFPVETDDIAIQTLPEVFDVFLPDVKILGKIPPIDLHPGCFKGELLSLFGSLTHNIYLSKTLALITATP